MKILLSHPTGNEFVRAVALKLLSQKQLAAFFTTIAVFPNTLPAKMAKGSLSELKRRTYAPELKPYTHTHPFYELGRMLNAKMKWSFLSRHEKGIFSVDNVYRNLDKYVANRLKKIRPDAVYAYEDGALQTFRKAKELGITCVYDLPIAYWEYGTRLMQEEAERLPEWANTLGGGIKDSAEKHTRKVKELELADAVVSPSKFVSNSLPQWAKNKFIIEAPFGTPETEEATLSDKKQTAKLRILFAGSMGQRKGLGDLFEAIKILNNKNVELVVLGSLLAPMGFYRKQLSNFTYEPTRPHSQVLELMRTCDVFCLPSIVEGRALVMQEAMSQGLPVIITPNTGGEDLVVEGETGFLVPIRNPDAIAEKINWFLENRNKIPAMGEKAKNYVSSYTWEEYGSIIINALQNYC